MGRSQYKIYEPTQAHFITCTILHWIPIFTNQESVTIILSSLQYLQKSDNLKIYAYVILENHLHLIIQSDDLSSTIQKFKRHTAKEIILLLKRRKVNTVLEQLAFYKKSHKKESTHQLWQEGSQAKCIQNSMMMKEKIAYIHYNPIKRGYVEEDWHWRYSSARNYQGLEGLIEIEKFY